MNQVLDAGMSDPDANTAVVVADMRRDRTQTVMAGGTGMYIQAFWNGLDELPAADPVMRGELAALV